MERAQADEVFSPLFQSDVRADEVNDIDSGTDFVYFLGRIPQGSAPFVWMRL